MIDTDLFYNEDWYQRWLGDLVAWYACWSLFSIVVGCGLAKALEAAQPVLEGAPT